MRNPRMPGSVRTGTTRWAFAGGWASSRACRKGTSRMRLRRPWTRRSIRANRIPRRTGPRGTGHWSWVDGDFDCRRNRSGKWPAVPGARTPYGFGSEASLLGQFGWFAENSGKHVHPPRELRPSIRGLFDLHGNLFEWCHDWFEDYGVEPVTDPLGAKEGTHRMIRGGSWVIAAAYCRSACRNTGDPTRPPDDTRLPPGPESAWSHAGGGTVKGAEPSGAGTKGATAERRPEMPLPEARHVEKGASSDPGRCCSSDMPYSVWACLHGFLKTPAITLESLGKGTSGYTKSPRGRARSRWGRLGIRRCYPAFTRRAIRCRLVVGLEPGV